VECPHRTSGVPQATCVTLVVQGAAEVWNPKESKGRSTTALFLAYPRVSRGRQLAERVRRSDELTGGRMDLLVDAAIGRVRAGEFVGEFRAFQVRVFYFLNSGPVARLSKLDCLAYYALVAPTGEGWCWLGLVPNAGLGSS
jgi:hypothetical protein